MPEQTENEKKVAQEIRKLHELGGVEGLDEKLADITIQSVNRDQGKKILLVKIPEELLAIVREDNLKLRNRLHAMYPDFYVLTIRNTKIAGVSLRRRFCFKVESKNMKRHVHESWIKDLCYPALVEMRKTDVFNGTERIESALVSNNSDYGDDDFSAMECAFKALTGRVIHYGHIFY